MAVTLSHAAAEQVLASPIEVRQARHVVESLTEGTRLSFQSDGAPEAVPAELSAIIERVVRAVATGATVTVGSLPREITTTTAAGLLSVSRPTVMKMIQRGELSARKVGTHSRLETGAVLALRDARRLARREALNELRDLEDELGL